MWIRDEIAAAVERLGVSAVELSASEACSVERWVEGEFATPGCKPLWERLQGGVGVQDTSAWQWIGEFVRGPVTMFVRDSQGLCAFRFGASTDLVLTIGECALCVFYAVDEGKTFVLAFNDHDFLIGCGAAAEWVSSLRDHRSGGV